MKTRTVIVVLLTLLNLMLCLVCACIWPAYFLARSENAIQSEKLAKEAQRWLQQNYYALSQATDDTELLNLRPGNASIGGTLRCAGGSYEQVFGADRPYAEVIQDYREWLLAHDWMQVSQHVFCIPDKHVAKLVVIRPYNGPETFQAQTVYELDLVFADCYEGWPKACQR